ncbi:MAG: DUF983 domain-containing protein [Rhizobiaceae bacterium]
MSVNYLADEPNPRAKRDLKTAIKRGLLGKCPKCGEGKLFRAFVKPVDNCSVCNEDYTPQQADDLPAYLVVTIVGHIVLAGFLATEVLTNWEGWVHLAIWIPVTIIMSLALLQPVKGGVIALQWANYMHGFSGDDDTEIRQV